MKKFIGIIALMIIAAHPALALEQIGRLGVGTTNQLINNLPALSVKVQRSRSFAIGGILGFNSENSDYGAGLKLYRILFEEPNLNFYSSIMAALLKENQGGTTYNGWQADLTLGTEMHFPGLESVGFSFEFGASLHKLQKSTIISTAGYHIVTAGIHFYL